MYVALLSIAIAYGSPGLYPKEERGGGGAQLTSNAQPATIDYHFNASDPGEITAVIVGLSGSAGSVTAALGGKSLPCRQLQDRRWYCNGSVPLAKADALRVVTQ